MQKIYSAPCVLNMHRRMGRLVTAPTIDDTHLPLIASALLGYINEDEEDDDADESGTLSSTSTSAYQRHSRDLSCFGGRFFRVEVPEARLTRASTNSLEQCRMLICCQYLDLGEMGGGRACASI